MTPSALILDLGGTIVDHGCLAPMIALRQAFASFGVEVTNQELREPMGLGKLDHIRAMMAMPRIAAAYDASELEAESIYEAFLPMQVEAAQQRAELVGGFAEVAAALRRDGMRFGATTGYPRIVTDGILAKVAKEFAPDVTVCTDEVAAGRPAPDMLLAVMDGLGASAAETVAVGDTAPDFAAARSAGLRSIGVVTTGSEIGLDERDWCALSTEAQSAHKRQAAARLTKAGADVVVDSVRDLRQALARLH